MLETPATTALVERAGTLALLGTLERRATLATPVTMALEVLVEPQVVPGTPVMLAHLETPGLVVAAVAGVVAAFITSPVAQWEGLRQPALRGLGMRAHRGPTSVAVAMVEPARLVATGRQTRLVRQAIQAMPGQLAPMAMQAQPETLVAQEAQAKPARMATQEQQALPELVLPQGILVARGMLALLAIQEHQVRQVQERRRVQQATQVLPPIQRTRTLQSPCERHILCRSPHLGKSQ